MKNYFLLFLLPLLANALGSQTTFQEFPKPLQLYPRNLLTNAAQVHILGTADAGIDSLLFTLEKSDGTKVVKSLSVNDLVGNQFDLDFEIQAGLWSYKLTAESKISGNISLLKETSEIVAGDVFAVQGQSNAQAVAYNGDANIWQNNFVRCFGDPHPANFADSSWYIAEGNGYFTPGAVGQWALRLGFLIQENLQVPVAVINGADPGKPIEFFQRNDAEHEDASTNYGRLLQRLSNAGVQGHVRGLVYYQGESDGDRADIHKTLFEALHAAWQEDIPGIEAYYVVQVREGCGAPSLQLRQYQKDFEDYLPQVRSVTVNGINGHDGCHYNLAGYQALGEKLFKQVSGDLYNAPTGEQTNIRAETAFFSDTLNTQITLLTDVVGPIDAQPGSAFDFKINGASASVVSIQAVGNQLILQLDQSVNSPGAGLSYAGHAGSDAWVLNAFGHGMFSFYNLPIGNFHELPNFDIPGIMSGPGNCVSLDGVDDCVFIGEVLDDSYTKEAWVSWQGAGLGNNILSGAANTAFWMPNGVLAAGHNGAWLQVADTEIMPANQWTHVAVSYDAASMEMKLYKNGNLISSASNVPLHVNDPQLYVGAYAGGYTFQGKIDEVRVWKTVRNMDEIRTNMCQKLQGNEPGLSAYFRFDETAGAQAPSATASPDGQLLNFQGLGLHEAWRRSAAPIGTKSTFTYENTNHLALSIDSGDSLVLSTPHVSDFVHLYFTEEVPNVLQAPDGFALVDNAQYFGLFYPAQSLDTYELHYHYAGNPFAFVQEPNLGLLMRRNNAQPYWEPVAPIQLNQNENLLTASNSRYQEYILAIRDSSVAPPALTVHTELIDSDICDGLANLIAVAQGGAAPYEYSLDGGPFQLSNTFFGLPSGVYSLEVLDATGEFTELNGVEIDVPQSLTAFATAVGDSVWATALGGSPPYWYSLDGGIQQPSGLFINLSAGTHTVVLTDTNECQATVSVTLTSGSANIPAETWGISISPNPSTGLFHIRPKKPTEAFRGRILDATGRLVQTFVESNRIDLRGQADGIYLLQMTDGQHWGTFKLIKTN